MATEFTEDTEELQEILNLVFEKFNSLCVCDLGALGGKKELRGATNNLQLGSEAVVQRREGKKRIAAL